MGPERTPISPKEKLLSAGREIVERSNLQHIAFIVDGNRRWAEKHGLPRVEGYRRALKVLLSRIEDCSVMGIPFVSAWLFSTENWKRSEEEVNRMFDLGMEMAPVVVEHLARFNLRFVHIGRVDRLRPDLLECIVGLEEETASNTGSTVLGLIDYGGQEEIAQAVTRAARVGVIEFTPEIIEQYLYTSGMPFPDLIVRTSGEHRTSGFMLWQTTYSEWVFTRRLFPDLSRESFINALRDFDKRDRRFGR